jgi:hypothetical protein
MNSTIKKCLFATVLAGAIAGAGGNAFALGSDYPAGRPVGTSSAWPKGMSELGNLTNRVHGFFVNAEDFFFYAGTADDLAAFLKAYSQIEGIAQHLLILYDGVGDAKSPWETARRPCDWELSGCPESWLVGHAAAAQGTNAVAARELAAKATNYVLEVHFWTGGKIALDQLTIPQNVELAGDCFRNFESITNGMTRAQVEKKLTMDGGLQTVSPVRFLDPGCPHFKIKVEFGYQRDARDQNRAIKGPGDKVILVSKPYLEEPFTD